MNVWQIVLCFRNSRTITRRVLYDSEFEAAIEGNRLLNRFEAVTGFILRSV